MKYTISEIRSFASLMHIAGYNIWNLDIPDDLIEMIANMEVVDWSYCDKEGRVMIDRSEPIKMWCENQVDVEGIVGTGYDSYKHEVYIRNSLFADARNVYYVDPSKIREETLNRSITGLENRIKSLNSTLRSVRKTLNALKAASEEGKE